MLFSDHNGSLLRRQPGAMTIGHSPWHTGKCTKAVGMSAAVRAFARQNNMLMHEIAEQQLQKR